MQFMHKKSLINYQAKDIAGVYQILLRKLNALANFYHV